MRGGDLEYQLVGRINVNKFFHNNPTKGVGYHINVAFFTLVVICFTP